MTEGGKGHEVAPATARQKKEKKEASAASEQIQHLIEFNGRAWCRRLNTDHEMTSVQRQESSSDPKRGTSFLYTIHRGEEAGCLTRPRMCQRRRKRKRKERKPRCRGGNQDLPSPTRAFPHA